MSFDLFVQRFVDGDAAPLPAAVVDALRPHVERSDEHHWHLRVADGGEADVYGADDVPLDGLMVNHFSSGDVLGLLVELCRVGDAVIMPADGPVLLVDPAQAAHLPADIAEEAVVVRDGADVEAAIAAA